MPRVDRRVVDARWRCCDRYCKKTMSCLLCGTGTPCAAVTIIASWETNGSCMRRIFEMRKESTSCIPTVLKMAIEKIRTGAGDVSRRSSSSYSSTAGQVAPMPFLIDIVTTTLN